MRYGGRLANRPYDRVVLKREPPPSNLRLGDPWVAPPPGGGIVPQQRNDSCYLRLSANNFRRVTSVAACPQADTRVIRTGGCSLAKGTALPSRVLSNASTALSAYSAPRYDPWLAVPQRGATYPIHDPNRDARCAAILLSTGGGASLQGSPHRLVMSNTRWCSQFSGAMTVRLFGTCVLSVL